MLDNAGIRLGGAGMAYFKPLFQLFHFPPERPIVKTKIKTFTIYLYDIRYEYEPPINLS
jgi:hypothetical protein